MAGPAAEGRIASPADSCVLAIFGGAGDLTRRLLIPALCNLIEAGLLSEHFAVLGIARTAMDSAGYRRMIEGAIGQFANTAIKPATKRWLVERCHYLQGSFDDPAA
jgi:glucose-6-phosphate 1-dehydrogenase